LRDRVKERKVLLAKAGRRENVTGLWGFRENASRTNCRST